MEEIPIKLIFWLLVGIMWVVSALAKKRKIESGPIDIGKVDTKKGYQAPEQELERFLKMVSGEAEEVTPVVKPIVRQAIPPVRPIVAETEEPEPEVEIFPQPRIETPAHVEIPARIEPEPGIVPIERIGEPQETVTIEKRLHIPSVSEMTLNELQRAIVLSEILGPPRAMKRSRLRH